MRNTLFLIFITVLQAYADDTYSQNTKLTLNLNNVTVANVLEEIQNNSEFYFLFNAKLIDVERKVSVSLEDKKISEILTSLFSGTGVNYLVYDRQIILTPSDVKSLSAAMQQLKITGTVVDKNGSSVPGVNVVVTGTTQGTITDIAGKYSIEVPQGGKSLTFSFIGMESQEITIGTLTQINVTMAESAIGLEEVVVIGYGTKSKATLTGSVAVVNTEQLESRPAARTTDLLQGVLAGVQITRSNEGRIKGTNSAITIRGLTSRSNPGVLFVIDGIANRDNSTYVLDNINPDDIESISVLKDAQASIYGSRASGGVVLVTTKKGNTDKPTIKFSANYNIQVPGLLRKGTNILQNVEMQNEGFVNDGQLTNMYTHIVQYIADNNLTMSEIKKNNGKYSCQWPFDASSNFVFGDYDWPKIMFGPAPMQTYNISVSGKTEKFNYYNSIGYINQDGMLNYGVNYNKRLFVKLKNGFKLTDFLEAKTNFDFQTQKVVEPSRYTDFEFWQGLIWPVFMPYNSAGHLYNFGSHQNPIGYAEDSGYSTDLNYRVNGQIGLVLTPFKDFTVTGEVSTNFDILENEWSNLGFDMYNENDVFSYNSTNNRNSAGALYRRSRYTVANLYANYEYALLDKHKFNFLVGCSHEEDDFKNFSAERRLGLISSQLPTFGVGIATEQYNAESKLDNALNSAFTRVDYNFNNEFQLEATLRYDGSSKFAKGYKWSPFWGISGAWTVSNEKFMQELKGAIDYLKIRASWGQMGNQSSIGLYDYISQINIGSVYPMGNPVSPIQIQSATLGGMASQTRSWETIETANLGIDYACLNSRLSFTIDLYVKDNKNMFFTKEFPQVLGTTAPSINGAHLRTKGWEFNIGWKDKIGEFNYFVNSNLSNSTNKVIQLAETAIPIQGTNGFLQGYPVGTYFGYKFDGFIQNESELSAYKSSFTSGIPNNLRLGDARYIDMDGDGKLKEQAYQLGSDGKPLVTSGDLVPIGDYGQYYLYGIDLGGNWKNIDIRVFFQGVLKWLVFETNRPIENNSWPPQAYFYGVTWTPTNTNALHPSLTQDAGIKNYDYAVSDAPYRLYNNKYIRLKNLQIGYTIPSHITKKVQMEKVRIYFSGTDIWEAYKIPGIYDPEKPFNPRISPMPRGYSFGVDVTF